MEFAELKMIWDSQNEEPLYALNEGALHRVVQRRNEETRLRTARCYRMEIIIGFVCGTLMLVCAGALAFGKTAWSVMSWIKVPVSPWDSLALFVAAGLWFFYSTYMSKAVRRQQQREETYDSSLRGDLERGLSQIEFQLAMARRIVWWGLIPLWLAAALWVLVIIHLVAAPSWTYLLMGSLIIGTLVMVVAAKQCAITNRFEPRKRELESLRAKLADPRS